LPALERGGAPPRDLAERIVFEGLRDHSREHVDEEPDASAFVFQERVARAASLQEVRTELAACVDVALSTLPEASTP